MLKNKNKPQLEVSKIEAIIHVIFHWQSSLEVPSICRRSETAKTKTWFDISIKKFVETQVTPLRLSKRKGHSQILKF